MNKANRAAQFNAFDALKGLQEALREKEEKLSRVEKRELGEEQQEELSKAILKLQRGTIATITYYDNGHYVEKQGAVSDINAVYGYIVIGHTKMFFDDICEVKML